MVFSLTLKCSMLNSHHNLTISYAVTATGRAAAWLKEQHIK